MANIINQYGQVKLGVRIPPLVSPLWNSIFGVWNGEVFGVSLDTSIYGVWNGENNANDSVGGNHGVGTGGLTYSTGKVGSAFQFNGTGSAINLTNNNAFVLNGMFTFSTWIYPTSFSSEKSILHNYPVEGGSGQKGFQLVLETNGRLRFRYTRTGNLGGSFSSDSAILLNQWSHIVFSFNLVTGAYQFYTNGVLVKSATYLVGTSILYPTNTALNYAQIGSTSYVGKLDSVTLWNKILTQAEVTNLYNGGNGAEYPFSTQLFESYNDAVGTNHGISPASTLTGGVPGPTFTTGKLGKAFNFDGVNDYIQLGDVMDIGISSWSYSYWFNSPNAFTTQLVFSKSLAGSSIGRVWSSIENNRVSFNFQADSSNVITTQMAASTIANNTWCHVVLVLDRTDKLKMYINGALYPITVFTGTNDLTPYTSTNYNTTHPFRIGAYTNADNTTPSGFFNGKIDAFNVWNKVLTQSEITELYNSGNGKQYPN
jgi:hypothetical protein